MSSKPSVVRFALELTNFGDNFGDAALNFVFPLFLPGSKGLSALGGYGRAHDERSLKPSRPPGVWCSVAVIRSG